MIPGPTDERIWAVASAARRPDGARCAYTQAPVRPFTDVPGSRCGAAQRQASAKRWKQPDRGVGQVGPDERFRLRTLLAAHEHNGDDSIAPVGGGGDARHESSHGALVGRVTGPVKAEAWRPRENPGESSARSRGSRCSTIDRSGSLIARREENRTPTRRWAPTPRIGSAIRPRKTECCVQPKNPATAVRRTSGCFPRPRLGESPKHQAFGGVRNVQVPDRGFAYDGGGQRGSV